MFYKSTASSYFFVQNIFFMHSLHSSHSSDSCLYRSCMCVRARTPHTHSDTQPPPLSPSHTHISHKHYTVTHMLHKHHSHTHVTQTPHTVTHTNMSHTVTHTNTTHKHHTRHTRHTHTTHTNT